MSIMLFVKNDILWEQKCNSMLQKKKQLSTSL